MLGYTQVIKDRLSAWGLQYTAQLDGIMYNATLMVTSGGQITHRVIKTHVAYTLWWLYRYTIYGPLGRAKDGWMDTHNVCVIYDSASWGEDSGTSSVWPSPPPSL